MNEMIVSILPEMEAQIVEQAEMKLIGIPCIGLNDMGSKYRLAKDSLLGLSDHMPQIVDANVQFGMWPQAPGQDTPHTHAYILSVEVSTFDGVPEWFVQMTIPAQRCVVAASKDGDFDGTGRLIDTFIAENGLRVENQGRNYTICERYRYNAEGFARYSLPITSDSN
ncbi:putative transcriptional regulator YdeE [Paenibacillus castaneae]|uniref:GyrI-like domain-containing protein n=1 Tax=Paenibacillus castaneae TaxID=474957 RepID=UPI000C99A55D|nr:GyrI-like domain-containing protein [Paenibacillus castaneae]NIK77735.1 putative transcriptional regulator YdeE [Paenibacillus castaneae]